MRPFSYRALAAAVASLALAALLPVARAAGCGAISGDCETVEDPCCSSQGYCGNSADYCALPGCQAAYSYKQQCEISPVPNVTVVTQVGAARARGMIARDGRRVKSITP